MTRCPMHARLAALLQDRPRLTMHLLDALEGSGSAQLVYVSRRPETDSRCPCCALHATAVEGGSTSAGSGVQPTHRPTTSPEQNNAQ